MPRGWEAKMAAALLHLWEERRKKEFTQQLGTCQISGVGLLLAADEVGGVYCPLLFWFSSSEVLGLGQFPCWLPGGAKKKN